MDPVRRTNESELWLLREEVAELRLEVVKLETALAKALLVQTNRICFFGAGLLLLGVILLA